MTWPAGIATAIGFLGIAMILASHHGIGTRTPPRTPPPDGEQP